MLFTELPLRGAFLIEPERRPDERGFFARVWCRDEFADHGLDTRLVQCNISYNRAQGTLRGMHLQIAPHAETKLVRCTAGAIYDVIVDLRPESPTFSRWHGERLSADNRRALYVPEGFAHGFLTLAADAEVLYQMSEFQHPESSRGVRWDDPAFGIVWPARPTVLSQRDAGYADFAP